MSLGRPVLAAGGVVWRGHHGDIEVAVIHRPRYDDWTLPKGKLEPGEPELVAAVREVGEEIGARVAVSRRVRRVSYGVGPLRKSVTYWAMQYRGGGFTPNDEVDGLAWLSPASARGWLTYDVDRSVLADFVALPLPDSVVVLVRHAKAGRRRDWHGDDALRPLDETGRRQAQQLAELLACFAPDRIISADRTRCIQTVEPLAQRLGLEIKVDPVFSDESYERSPSATQTALLSLAKPGRVSVVCSQGTTIPSLIEVLGTGGTSPETRKGAAWALSFVDGDVIAADYYPPATG
ncbi:MAG: 8-oxo-(d)GTP phosphatase [Pseudonocardiales bacterium]|nr:8-oxo-(d)GTP phosphatase [Pseudonocardiales bacterium]